MRQSHSARVIAPRGLGKTQAPVIIEAIKAAPARRGGRAGSTSYGSLLFRALLVIVLMIGLTMAVNEGMMVLLR